MTIPKVRPPTLKTGIRFAGPIDRLPDRRIQLAIQADDRSFVKDRRRVVELTRSGNLGKPQDCRDRVACKWCKRGAELAAFHVNRDIGRACSVVRQTSKYGLRATEDFHSLRFTPVNSFANELDRLH